MTNSLKNITVTMQKVQVDITMKGLLLLAKEKNLDIPADTLEILERATERDPYETELINILDVLEVLKYGVLMNDDYK